MKRLLILSIALLATACAKPDSHPLPIVSDQQCDDIAKQGILTGDRFPYGSVMIEGLEYSIGSECQSRLNAIESRR